MSAQPLTYPVIQYSTLPIPTQESPPIEGCWERMVNGVKWFSRIVVQSSNWFVELITSIAFSALRSVWPTGADRAEAIWGKITTIYERIRAAIREETFQADIDRLEAETQNLNIQVRDLTHELEALRVNNDHIDWEQQTLIEELALSRATIDEKIRESVHLNAEKEAFQRASRQLVQRLQGTEAQLNTAIEEKERASQEKEAFRAEHDQALQRVAVIQQQLDNAHNNDILVTKFDQMADKYRAREVNPNAQAMTEAELVELIPVLDEQKETYRQMIQDILADLPDQAPLQVPLQGLLTASREETDHLKRVSEAVHFYAQLLEPIREQQAVVQRIEEYQTHF